jgi:hypothetical protein
MPRAKPNKASPHFVSHGHPLSDAAKAKLINLLDYGESNAKTSAQKTGLGRMILDVEQALGIYVDGAQHIDNIPRPTHYVSAFRPIEREARKLSERLFEMTYYFSDQLSTRNVEPNNIAADLLTLAEVSKTVIGTFKGKPSMGSPRNTALCEVIRRLRHIFRNKYQGPRTGRARNGAFQFRAEEEKQELAFVETALRDARVIPKGYRELPRLFLDPRCALPEERQSVMRRIAKKVHHNREREQKGNNR